MKNKVLGKINLRDTFLIISVSFFCWILLRAILPNYPPNLMNPYNLCDTFNIYEITPQNSKDIRMFQCKTKIPVDILFRAKTIYVSILSNQEVSMTVSLHRNGSGGMQPSSQRIFPESSTSGNLVVYDLDSKNNPKINWLTGDYDEVILNVNNFKSLDNIKVNIQNVYLK